MKTIEMVALIVRYANQMTKKRYSVMECDVT